jgi:hypothetical protein
MDPDSFSKLDPDPDSPKKLDQNPHEVKADPKHRSMYGRSSLQSTPSNKAPDINADPDPNPGIM